MKSAELVVMAAGMGSRFGGLKQAEPVGANGEIILDYSVYDAVKAGFDRVIFIIRRDIEKDFREITKKRIEKRIDCDFVFQDSDKLPRGFSVPNGRVKPWGTGHAVYCAMEKATAPFALINADDYYGQSSFKIIHDWLVSSDEACMVGFRLGNTLTENGTVSRGVCETENGYLKSVTEYTALDKNSPMSPDLTVSMNMWGLSPDISGYLEGKLADFLGNMKNPIKDEFYIPYVINDMMHETGKRVKVLETEDRWYGVTYRADKKTVERAMAELTERGLYDGI